MDGTTFDPKVIILTGLVEGHQRDICVKLFSNWAIDFSNMILKVCSNLSPIWTFLAPYVQQSMPFKKPLGHCIGPL